MSDDLIGRADSLMRRGRTFVAGRVAPAVVDDGIPVLTEEVDLDTLVPEPEVIAMGPLLDSLRRLSRLAVTCGNAVEVLRNGDEAMPAMLDAIDRAKESVCLGTYIFEVQGIGSKFVAALERARSRGVEVRVMVDDAGTRYAWPPVTRELDRRGGIMRVTGLPH